MNVINFKSLEFNGLHWPANVFKSTVSKLVLQAVGAEAWESPPEHFSVRLTKEYYEKSFLKLLNLYLANVQVLQGDSNRDILWFKSSLATQNFIWFKVDKGPLHHLSNK